MYRSSNKSVLSVLRQLPERAKLCLQASVQTCLAPPPPPPSPLPPNTYLFSVSASRMFSRRPARDIDTFLEGYPDLPSAGEEDRSWDRNLRFYLGEERCEPDDMLIDEIHEEYGGVID